MEDDGMAKGEERVRKDSNQRITQAVSSQPKFALLLFWAEVNRSKL